MTWDNQEFAAVFNELYPGVCRFLGCMLGSAGAQDVAQETFVRLFRKGSGTMPAEEVRFWIYRVARNLALNELNKTGTRYRLVDQVRTHLNIAATNPEQEYEHAERKQLLTSLLKLIVATTSGHQFPAIMGRMEHSTIGRAIQVDSFGRT